jgi:protein phosphatase
MDYRTSQDYETLSVTDTAAGILVRSSVATSVGMVRGNNEDSIRVWSFGAYILGLVADGMGGAAGGEEASRIAVQYIQSELVEAFPDATAWATASEDDVVEKIRLALTKANQAVLERATQDHQLHGMGTTATMVIVRGKRAIFAHIGDSRAYLINGLNRHISQITSDHSFVEALVSSGHLTKEQAAEHPMRNVLYRALGQKPENELEIDIYKHDLGINDRLVLCSDGLTRHVEDREIGELAAKLDDPHEIAQRLIALANERGGEDNISVVVFVLSNLE